MLEQDGISSIVPVNKVRNTFKRPCEYDNIDGLKALLEHQMDVGRLRMVLDAFTRIVGWIDELGKNRVRYNPDSVQYKKLTAVIERHSVKMIEVEDKLSAFLDSRKKSRIQ